jgi:hypothetical protein
MIDIDFSNAQQETILAREATIAALQTKLAAQDAERERLRSLVLELGGALETSSSEITPPNGGAVGLLELDAPPAEGAGVQPIQPVPPPPPRPARPPARPPVK